MGAVSYRNAKPLVYGIGQPPMTDIMDLSFQYPARLVEQLQTGTIDIGLIPVAAIQHIAGAQIIGSYGIAADGPVGSVALFSACPIEEVTEVALDYQSRTSVALAKILLHYHWRREVQFIPSTTDEYINDISGTRAGLIIGDRALLQAGRFPYVYDLSAAWKEYTTLPFVFAVWVATTDLPPEFLNSFEKANEAGLSQLDVLAEQWSLPGVDIHTYYKQRIHYRIDEPKRKGLRTFLSLLEMSSIS